MKCTGKMNKKKNISESLNRSLNLLLATVTVSLLVLGSILCWKVYRNDRSMDLSFPYERSFVLSTDPLTVSDRLHEKGFAWDLCVSEADIPQSDIQIGENEKSGLFDLDDKKTLFAQNLYEKAYPASITKIMTALLALEYNHPDEIVTMKEEDFALESGSQVSRLAVGDSVTMDELFHTLLIFSANDAAMAIARQISGSEEAFVQKMNDRARELGMTGTHFVNPHGLHDENHYTTAYDVYLMLREAYQYSEFRDTVAMSSYTLTPTHPDGSSSNLYLTSTDKYLTGEKQAPQDVTVLGGKTGTTTEAGACLAIISQDAYGKSYLSVILNARTKEALYQDMNLLLSKINS